MVSAFIINIQTASECKLGAKRARILWAKTYSNCLRPLPPKLRSTQPAINNYNSV